MQKLFTGNCAIVHGTETLRNIPFHRVESFTLVGISQTEALSLLRSAFNADELEDEESRLEVAFFSEEPLVAHPVFLGAPIDWEVFDDELQSV